MCVFCAPVRMCVCVHACERCCKLCGGLSGKKRKRNKTGRGMKDVCVELYFKCVARGYCIYHALREIQLMDIRYSFMRCGQRVHCISE